MTIKERDLLFKLHQQVVKLSTPPLTTFSANTGQLPPLTPPNPSTTPIPLPPTPK